MPAGAIVLIMMLVAALITAEFLILPAIPDFVAALQTTRTLTSLSISVTHI